MTASWVEQSPATRITNACTFVIMGARHISQPGAREKRHGKGSDAQQQGKEETEGRAEHQEGRRDAIAVLIRQAADAARPEPRQQEVIRLSSCRVAPA